MPAKCKKCDPHEICEECPEWIFTLADLIMCMMGLFVLLWVLKPSGNPAAPETQKQEQHRQEVLNAIEHAFSGYDIQPSQGDPTNSEQDVKKMRLVGPGEKGTQQDPQPAAEGSDPQVQTIREGKLTPVGTRVLFAAGDATLGADDKRLLNQAAEKMAGMQYVIVVKGHAARDDFGEHGTPQQYMDVSVKRAQAAADYLVGRGVSPEVLRVQGCSTFEPVREQAYTADRQRANRRAEVFATDTLVADLRDPNVKSAKPIE